jgi:hypothetical protein
VRADQFVGFFEQSMRARMVTVKGKHSLRPFFAHSFAGRPHRDSEPLKSIWYIGTLWEVSPSPEEKTQSI